MLGFHDIFLHSIKPLLLLERKVHERQGYSPTEFSAESQPPEFSAEWVSTSWMHIFLDEEISVQFHLVNECISLLAMASSNAKWRL